MTNSVSEISITCQNMAFIEGAIHIFGIDITVKRHEADKTARPDFQFFPDGKPLFDTGDPNRDRELNEAFTRLLQGQGNGNSHT